MAGVLASLAAGVVAVLAAISAFAGSGRPVFLGFALVALASAAGLTMASVRSGKLRRGHL